MENNKIICDTNSICIGEIFQADLKNFLEVICVHNSTCLEFLLCPLISAVSYTLQQSQITALRTMKESMSLYTALVAQPSTGKSPAMKMVRRSILEIESHNNVTPDDSKLVNGNPFDIFQI